MTDITEDITPNPDEISPKDIQGDIPQGDIPESQGDADSHATDETPAKWPRPWMAAFIERMRRIPTITDAADHVGVSRKTAQRWMQRDETFALAVEDARQMAIDVAERIAYLRATIGTPVRKTVTKTFADGAVETTVTEESHISDNLLTLILRRWRPEYRESYRTEVTGAGGGPVQVQSIEDIDLRIAALTAEMAKQPVSAVEP